MALTPATLRLDACWEGYVQVGMKRKGKRRVPNCVPASSGVAQPRRQSDAETRMDPRGSKVAAMEAELAKQAAARGLKGERAAAYIYGTLNKMGYKKGSKTTRKGAAKAKRTDAEGIPCGASYIPANHTCSKKTSIGKKAAVAAGVGVAALGIGALAYTGQRRRMRVQPVQVRVLQQAPRPRLAGTPERARLPGITPKGLLPPARERKSKTQRMRENTAAAVTAAEKRIAQTAKEEVRRLGQIGNAMAAAGEAAGMATKTTSRELRLRTEAARRRFEPGYRRPDQKRLPESTLITPALLMAFPEGVPIPASTPKPRRRRRKPQGFGRTDAAGPASSGAAAPRAQRDTEDDKKYSKKVRDPKTGRTRTIRYGAKGYRIAPGTDKGDRYCARSFGDMKSHGKDCAGKDRNTPLCLSRAKWKCSGKVSRRDEGLTPRTLNFR
jgi:hypothetical protein